MNFFWIFLNGFFEHTSPINNIINFILFDRLDRQPLYLILSIFRSTWSAVIFVLCKVEFDSLLHENWLEEIMSLERNLKNLFRDSRPILYFTEHVVWCRSSGLTHRLTGWSSCTPAASYAAMAAVCIVRWAILQCQASGFRMRLADSGRPDQTL